jgi:hypothetical protein
MRTWLVLLAIWPLTLVARAQEPAPSAKIAIVVVGDPDSVLQEGVAAIEGAIASEDSLRLPTDSALSLALRGHPEEPDDGLEHVRRERRRLGLGETSDAPILQRLGRLAGAVLVVAVRQGAAGSEAVTFDVNRGQFFEGAIAFPAPGDRLVAFLAARARAALRSSTQETAASSALDVEAAIPERADSAPQGAITPEGSETPQERDWFEENWPYFAAGALLVGAIVFVVVAATDGGDPPPMLRFQPGAP